MSEPQFSLICDMFLESEQTSHVHTLSRSLVSYCSAVFLANCVKPQVAGKEDSAHVHMLLQEWQSQCGSWREDSMVKSLVPSIHVAAQSSVTLSPVDLTPPSELCRQIAAYTEK